MSIVDTPALKHRVFQAGVWTLGGHAASQLLRLGSNLILTRLLVPEMFGIMALANVLIVGLTMFSDLGLRQNIVQSPRGNDSVFLNTVWTVQIVRGGLMSSCGLVMSLAIYFVDRLHGWPTASAYADPILPFVIALLSFNALISGFESTKLATANRDLTFGRITLIDLTCQIFGILFMLGWAWVDRSIWALASSSLVYSMLRVVLSHIALPGIKNQLHWDRQSFAEIFRFGKWIFATSILGFLVSNGDRIILGGLNNTGTLGLYTIAAYIVSALQDVFDRIAAHVAYPALSEVIRERPSALKQTYYKFRAPIDSATLLATGILFSSGHLVIEVLYDDRYLPAAKMVEILCISLFAARYYLVVQCLNALGKPKLFVPILLIRLFALYGIMPLSFVWYGLTGALWVAGGSALLALPLYLYFQVKLGLFDFAREVHFLPLLAIGYFSGKSLDWFVGKTGWLT